MICHVRILLFVSNSEKKSSSFGKPGLGVIERGAIEQDEYKAAMTSADEIR